MFEIETQAAEGWRQLVRLLDVEAGAADSVYADLFRRYTEPHRHYHTLHHVVDLLSKADDMSQQVTDPRVVALASWFHDAVYDPHRHDNERESAQLAAQTLQALGVEDDLIEQVKAFVMATAKHAMPPQAHPDLGLFLDLDLSILGAEPERYQAYADAIRKEYEWVPASVYKSARRDVLNRFLRLAQEGELFHTERFRALYGARAIDNLRRELPTLS